MKLKNVLILSISLVMIMSSAVFAEIPDQSIILGDKAYHINYFFLPELLDDINEQLNKAISNGYGLSYRLNDDNYRDMFTGEIIPQEVIQDWPSITYLDSNGSEVVYDKGNGGVIDQPNTYYADVNVESSSIPNIKRITIISVDKSFTDVTQFRVLRPTDNIDVTRDISERITVLTDKEITIQFLDNDSKLLASGILDLKSASGEVKMIIRAEDSTPVVKYFEVTDIY